MEDLNTLKAVLLLHFIWDQRKMKKKKIVLCALSFLMTKPIPAISGAIGCDKYIMI